MNHHRVSTDRIAGGSPARRRLPAGPATFVCLTATAFLFSAGAAVAADKVQGIVEKSGPPGIVVDSALVSLARGGRLKGDFRSLGRVKVGSWAVAEGRFKEGGDFEAEKIEVERDAPGSSYAGKLSEASLQETKKLDASGKIYKDPQVDEYVRRIGEGLVPDYAKSGFSFSFGVIRDPSLNAFALPNGAIYVHTGLLARLDNEAQLAIVVGHEISHVTQKHGQRQYRTQMTTVLPATIGAAVLGITLEQRSDNPLYQVMVGLGLNLGLSAAVSGYGRTLEDQADRVGLRYAVDAGYDPREGPKVWDIFNDVYGDESKVENFFYGNHSTNEVRRQNLRRENARHYTAADFEQGKRPDTVNAETYQKSMLNLTRDNAVDDFHLKRYRLASNGFDRVLKYRPGDPVAHHYRGRIILATDKTPDAADQARSEYLKAISLAPDYGEAHRDLGLLYRQMKRPADARQHLGKYLELAPRDAKDRKEIEKILRDLG